MGLSKDNKFKFIILRFVSWGATHDIGDKGFANKEGVVKILEQYGRIFVSSEAKLGHNLEKYKINISPEKIHHILYFAHLYIGESAPMATESAILGTPSIFVSTSRRGYTDELERKYNLVYSFSNPKTMQMDALKKAVNLLENENTKRKWKKKRKHGRNCQKETFLKEGLLFNSKQETGEVKDRSIFLKNAFTVLYAGFPALREQLKLMKKMVNLLVLIMISVRDVEYVHMNVQKMQ